MPTPEPVHISWPQTHRIIRSRFPPIDLFEDIADPADWEAILSAEQKTNPRLAESVGQLDLVPEHRRVSGPGASWAMAPFTHASPDRPSRFTDGSYGVYYAGDRIEVALFETIYHHGVFMAATSEEAGWVSDFRELVGTLAAELHDIADPARFPEHHHPQDYAAPQALARRLRKAGSDGVHYQSVRYPDGKAVALFWPDVVGLPAQGRHYAYYWDGAHVTLVKDRGTGDVFSVVA